MACSSPGGEAVRQTAVRRNELSIINPEFIMVYRIAVTGKGGTGKTTVAALSVLRLIAQGKGPVLAVDADPNTCLDAALGMTVAKTLGAVREEARTLAQQGLAAGMGKQQLLEMKIAESLVEGDDIDLIAMGRSEGPGCYCYANSVLKTVMAELSGSYPYMVLDNEAGLENLSRRLAPQVDMLIAVSDPSRRGLETVHRLHALTGEMGIEYRTLVLVVNRCRGTEPPAYAAEIARAAGADRLIALPDDEQVARAAEQGVDYRSIPETNDVVARLDSLIATVPVSHGEPSSVSTGKQTNDS
ncbi:MAG: AAA family ATPase [Chitinivibrionales bacterium]|nr:AAA family ATPase [Chitinivibrionales bacterium]